MTRTRLIDKGWNKIEKELRILKEAFTAVGFFSEDRSLDKKFYIASIAAVNDLGSVDGRIPERPFKRNWFDNNKKKIETFIKQLYLKVSAGTMTAKQAIGLLGEFGQSLEKKSLLNLKAPPNAPSTVKRKKSSNPLIDKGTMLNSIRHKEYFRKVDKPK